MVDGFSYEPLNISPVISYVRANVNDDSAVPVVPFILPVQQNRRRKCPRTAEKTLTKRVRLESSCIFDQKVQRTNRLLVRFAMALYYRNCTRH